jgi:septal ring factor EnvC (AmiA/AmiB activator)
MELQVLAYQSTEYNWQLDRSKCLSIDEPTPWHEGMLVLVKIDEGDRILEIREAKDWILNLLETFLNPCTITPEFVERERIRIEEWRQELTAQSLDLNRQHLEIETRREQLQELEKTLKQEQEKLALFEEKLNINCHNAD